MNYKFTNDQMREQLNFINKDNKDMVSFHEIHLLLNLSTTNSSISDMEIQNV